MSFSVPTETRVGDPKRWEQNIIRWRAAETHRMPWAYRTFWPNFGWWTAVSFLDFCFSNFCHADKGGACHPIWTCHCGIALGFILKAFLARSGQKGVRTQQDCHTIHYSLISLMYIYICTYIYNIQLYPIIFYVQLYELCWTFLFSTRPQRHRSVPRSGCGR